jgi:phage head maturation protease
VVETSNPVTDQEAEVIRAALRTLDEVDRRSMWQCLELVDQLLAKGAADRVERAIRLAPDPVRSTVAQVAALRLERARPKAPNTPHWHRLPATHRPATTIVGRAANHDHWTSTGWTWASFAPTALEALSTGRHSPVPILYRHDGPPIGLTRRLMLTEGGDLDLEAMVLPDSRSQWAMRYVADGTLRGLSPGVVSRDSRWTHLDPCDWRPDLGQLDLARRHRVDLAEVSVTPNPAQPASTIRAWW